MNVPLLDLRAQYEQIREETEEAIKRIVESQGFVLGPEVEALERRIAEYSQAQFAIGCASGSDALMLALMAHGIGVGDEVICPSYTFFATGGAIARLGAVPVYVDIDPITFNLDLHLVSERARDCKRLKAIMPVHLYGQCVDMEQFVLLGEQLKVPIIEDAAQAIGASDEKGHRAGSHGSIGCFSFYPTKNLGAFGDAGMVTTSTPHLADKLRKLRVHGERSRYYHDLVGVNSRIDSIQAAVLNVKLRYLDDWTGKRQKNAAYLDEAFGPAREMGLETPKRPGAQARHIYNQYVVRIPGGHRDALREHLKEQGIGNGVYYPVPLHLQECFEYLGYKPGDLPESERAAAETLALPIYPELTTAGLDLVAQTVTGYLAQQAKVGVGH